MSNDRKWDAPGPSPWQQDGAHTPVSQTRLMQQIWLVRSIDNLFDVEQGDVLVAPTTGEAFNSMLRVDGTTGQVTILG